MFMMNFAVISSEFLTGRVEDSMQFYLTNPSYISPYKGENFAGF